MGDGQALDFKQILILNKFGMYFFCATISYIQRSPTRFLRLVRFNEILIFFS